MTTLDDLLIKRRHGTLSEAEARRLEIAVRSASEFELAARLADVFEREGQPQAGDDPLIERVLGEVELARWGRASRAGAPRISRIAALPLLLAGVAAAAIGVEHFGSEPLAPRPPESVEDRGAQRVEVAMAEGPAAAPSEARPELEPPRVEPLPPAGAPAVTSRARSITRRAAPREAPAEPPERLEGKTRVDAPSTEPTEPTAPISAGLAVAGGESARAMFQRANRLRRDDWARAEAVYLALIQQHPTTHEAGIAEMALGKHALESGRALEALSWFRAHQRRTDSELAPEALWGEARALESRGQFADARSAWRRLIERYPGSAYAAIARQRLED